MLTNLVNLNDQPVLILLRCNSSSPTFSGTICPEEKRHSLDRISTIVFICQHKTHSQCQVIQAIFLCNSKTFIAQNVASAVYGTIKHNFKRRFSLTTILSLSSFHKYFWCVSFYSFPSCNNNTV